MSKLAAAAFLAAGVAAGTVVAQKVVTRDDIVAASRDIEVAIYEEQGRCVASFGVEVRTRADLDIDVKKVFGDIIVTRDVIEVDCDVFAIVRGRKKEVP